MLLPRGPSAGSVDSVLPANVEPETETSPWIVDHQNPPPPNVAWLSRNDEVEIDSCEPAEVQRADGYSAAAEGRRIAGERAAGDRQIVDDVRGDRTAFAVGSWHTRRAICRVARECAPTTERVATPPPFPSKKIAPPDRAVFPVKVEPVMVTGPFVPRMKTAPPPFSVPARRRCRQRWNL